MAENGVNPPMNDPTEGEGKLNSVNEAYDSHVAVEEEGEESDEYDVEEEPEDNDQYAGQDDEGDEEEEEAEGGKKENLTAYLLGNGTGVSAEEEEEDDEDDEDDEDADDDDEYIEELEMSKAPLAAPQSKKRSLDESVENADSGRADGETAAKKVKV